VDNYLLEVDHPLVVPKGAKVRVLLTSNDVIHAWWVPDLAVKKDAVPGFINETFFKAAEAGVYRGQCAELCGMDHGYMPIVVEVLEPDAFQAWLDTKKNDAANIAASN
jgi:cytochrome c oxidase subunit 2